MHAQIVAKQKFDLPIALVQMCIICAFHFPFLCSSFFRISLSTAIYQNHHFLEDWVTSAACIAQCILPSFKVPEFQIAAVHLKSIACEDICGHQFTNWRGYCLKIVIIACFHVLFSSSIKVLSVHHCLSKDQTYSIPYTYMSILLIFLHSELKLFCQLESH